MRRFSYLLLSTCLCFPLIGCGDDAAAPAPESTATESGGADADSAPSDGGSESKDEESGSATQ